MSYDNGFSFVLPSLFFINETENNNNCSDTLLKPIPAVHIAFYIGQVISIICIIFGVLGNTALILTIYRSSFCRFPYGLLLLFIAIFDIIRLISTTIYYLIQAYIISFNLATMTIYISLYRYPKNVTNWLKVFLAIERIIAIKYWIANRYNVNSINTTKIQRSKQRRTLSLIFLLLICSLISQHPNLIPNRYISPSIDPIRLFLVAAPNPNFYYGQNIYNGVLFIILSYIILDDMSPIITLIILNTILLHKLRHLPLIISKKLGASIWILCFLTTFSIFGVPRSFITFLNLYVDPKEINQTIISVVFHIFQGLEMMNHAFTGYACFLSCQNLRKSFIEFIQIIFKKPQVKSNLSTPYTIGSTTIVLKRI